MELFIRVIDGQPVDHPIFGDNFREAFPDIDPENLPPQFARFTRVAPPATSVYETYLGATYEFDGVGFTDVHHVQAMTEEERIAKQDAVKADWAVNGFASWVFEESLCQFVPPFPPPNDGKVHLWDEPTVGWIEAPEQQPLNPEELANILATLPPVPQ